MGLGHKLPIIQRLKREVEMRGYCLAVSGTREYHNGRWCQSLHNKTIRIYRSERDKGKPERALYTTDQINRFTVQDAIGALLELEYAWLSGENNGGAK